MVDNKKRIYQLDGRVPLVQAVPFGLQHVLAMFVANITPIIILANVVGIEQTLSGALIQNCMIIAGIGTLIQLYPIWRIGSRLPIVMGISFTFLSLAIFIATTQGMGALMGAVVIGGIVEGLLGLFAKYWLFIISRVVAATVVTAIGFVAYWCQFFCWWSRSSRLRLYTKLDCRNLYTPYLFGLPNFC